MAYLPPVTSAVPNYKSLSANDKLEQLVSACRGGSARAVEALVRDMSPEEINKVSSSGYLPITAAVEGRDQEAVMALFKKGADFHKADDFGRSAVSMANEMPAGYWRLKLQIESLASAQK
jgi:hypothetical protein